VGGPCVEDKLYIVMELIEGATLAEHFSSLKEKQQKFSESRIWNIFLQVGHHYQSQDRAVLELLGMFREREREGG